MYIYFLSDMDGYESGIMTHETEYSEEEFRNIVEGKPDEPGGYLGSDLMWLMEFLKDKGFKEPSHLVYANHNYITKIQGCD